jgi:hypothetical protein
MRNQLIVVCVYARRRRVAAGASPPSRRRRCVAAVALPSLRCRCCVAAVLVAVLVAILVAATLVVVVITLAAAVASASWMPWLKSKPVLAAVARMGGSRSNLKLLLKAVQGARDKNTTICVFPHPMRRDKIVDDSRHFTAWGEKGGEIGPKRR